MFKNIIKYGLILLLVSTVAALVLSYVNTITADKIAVLEQEREMAARLEVMQGIDYENEMDLGNGIWEYTSGGMIVGYAVSEVTAGYGGDVNIMVGIGGEKQVLGVKIVSFNETPGLGSKAKDSEFLNQFAGKTFGINLKKGGIPEKDEVLAISGATITSEAVRKGVNSALEKALDKFKEGPVIEEPEPAGEEVEEVEVIEDIQ